VLGRGAVALGVAMVLTAAVTSCAATSAFCGSAWPGALGAGKGQPASQPLGPLPRPNPAACVLLCAVPVLLCAAVCVLRVAAVCC